MYMWTQAKKAHKNSVGQEPQTVGLKTTKIGQVDRANVTNGSPPLRCFFGAVLPRRRSTDMQKAGAKRHWRRWPTYTITQATMTFSIPFDASDKDLFIFPSFAITEFRSASERSGKLTLSAAEL